MDRTPQHRPAPLVPLLAGDLSTFENRVKITASLQALDAARDVPPCTTEPAHQAVYELVQAYRRGRGVEEATARLRAALEAVDQAAASYEGR